MTETEPHAFVFSTNWRGQKRLCRACNRTYDDGSHIEVRALKPYTHYVCPVASPGELGHSSCYSGSQDVPELRSERDKFCYCGAEFIERDNERWLLEWEMRDPATLRWRNVEVIESRYEADQQEAGLNALAASGEPIRNIRRSRLEKAPA